MLDVPTLADLNLGAAAPVIFLSLFVTILLLVDVLFIPQERKILTAYLTLAALMADSASRRQEKGRWLTV